MKIAVIGAFGTAKKALAHKLAGNAEMNGRITCVIDDFARDFTFPYYDDITLESAYYFISTQIARELDAKNCGIETIICSNSTIDPIVYLGLRKLKNPYNELEALATKWMHTYDIILYVTAAKHEIFRMSEELQFQENIDYKFYTYLESIFLDYLKTNIYKIGSDDIAAYGAIHSLVQAVGNEDWVKEFL
jgi:hypothetical protein